jgi:peptidoglycan/LPS O-acetylase OafA/YrhL
LPLILFGAVTVVFVWREALIAMGAIDLRIYFALDTRADALLVGCAVGALRYNGFHLSGRAPRMAAPPRSEQMPSWLSIAGPLAFIALLIVVGHYAPKLNAGITWLDRGGYTLVAVLAGLVVMSVDQSRPGWWSRLLGSRPLAAFGRISYAFYLWHFPVTAYARPLARVIGVPGALALGFVASTALAYLSMELIERPAQRRRPLWARPFSSSLHPA